MDEKRKDEVKRSRPKRRRRRRERPITRADVTRFLDSPVARRYYAFSESNVKRQLVRLLLFLSNEVEQLERRQALAEAMHGGQGRWVKRLTGEPATPE